MCCEAGGRRAMAPDVSLLMLFCVFFYVGLFTIGGGLVAITIMQQVIVEKYQLVPVEMFYNMVAVSESTPGPMGINMATYVGTELYGPLGGVVTTCGTVLPSLIIIVIIARFFGKVQERPLVKAAFSGLRPATTGIIAVAAAKIFVIALLVLPQDWRSLLSAHGVAALFDWRAVFFYAVACLLLFRAKVHPLSVVLLGAVFGVMFL